MEIFGFVLSVWAAIGIGVFFIAMVFACTADRHDRAFPKWGIFFLGLAVLAFWQWHDFTWRELFSAQVFKTIGIYLAIGLGYSVVEFYFNIRREAREWGNEWERFKNNRANSVRRGEEPDPIPMAQRFVDEGRGSYNSTRLTKVGLGTDGEIIPVINRKELAESIGCWMLFWPAYAVSLLLGDLLTELCSRLADLLTVLSGEMVRRAFAKVFKP